MLSDEEKENLIKKLRYCEQEYEQNGYLCMLYGTYLYNIKNPEFIKINTGYFTGT